MYVFDLEFTSMPRLLDAFGRIQNCRTVTACTLESDRLRLQFVASAEDAGAVAERIYLEGGLTWCTSHRLVVPTAASDR